MPSTRPRVHLALIVALLLIQFALRAHHPLAMAAFWDEASHISRARALVHLEGSPVAESHGKLLLYFWLGAFAPDSQHGALAVSRLAIALFSLVGSAGMMAAARLLFGRRAMIPALAFYALLPWALFFDRMAFADPFAGALGALVAWQSLRLAKAPTRRQGVIVGMLVALAALAKLTTAVVAGLPVLAIVLMGRERLRATTPTAVRDWLRSAWTTYRPALVTAAVVAILPWIVVLASGAYLAGVEGRHTILLDTYLIGDNTREGGVFDRLENTFWTKTGLLISHPMTILLAALAVLLLWKRPAAGVYALAWLGAIWLPITLFATELQSRYLVASLPALAVIFGGGVVMTGDRIGGMLGRGKPLAGAILATGVIGVWAVGFALPFVRTATTDPARLDMPYRDITNYFSGLFTTWGTSAAFEDLAAHGERVDGRVPAVGVLRVCDVHSLFMPGGIAWACMSSLEFPDQKVPRDVSSWAVVEETLSRWPFVYVMTDYLPPLAAPENAGSQRWEWHGAYPRPHGGDPVTVWRVSRAAP